VLAGTELGALSGPQDILSPPLLLALAALGLFPWLARGFLAVLARRRALRGFVRPRRFDDNVIVIGGGSGGLIAALIAATARAEVTLVERDAMGGDCLNRGCVPSKALLSAAHLASAQRRGRPGVRSLGVEVDFAEVMGQVHSAIATIEPKDSAERYESLGVKVLKGSATLVDPWTVEVNGTRRTARAIILATGGEPLVPPIPGLADCDPLTSDTLWRLTEAPSRCLVLGAGPIGCELAQSLAALGSSVTLVDQASQVLPREDDAVGAVVAAALDGEGITLRLGAQAELFTPGAATGSGTLTLAGGETIAFDRVLVAVGRRPVTEGLDLDALGVARLPNGALAVDETLRASIPTIYGCGDVVGPYQFTHMASDQAYVAAMNALFRPLKAFKWTGAIVPWVTFTAPEVARVGLSEREAQAQGLGVTVTRVGYDDNDRAIAEGETAGFIQVLTPPGKDRILGVTIVGARAGELLAPWVLAMTHGLGLKKIMSTIHAYPTYAELNKAVASAWRKAHAPEQALDLLRHWHGLWR
jgi:pyruvate/2-oxoglutarate dehydrogenase complex dihydrolipoamide dehydrogenase (E3) component